MKKYVVIFLIVLFFIILFIGSYFILKPDFKIKNFNDYIEISYKDNFNISPGDICYGNIIKCNDVNITYTEDVDTNTLDEYNVTYTYSYKNKTLSLKQTVKVIDNKSPIITINDNDVIVCPNGKIDKLDFKIEDDYDNNLTDKLISKIENNKLILEVSDSSNNKTTKTIDAKIIDEVSPIITLNGNSIKNILINNEYIDEGATAIDNCDDVTVEVENNVNTNKTGTYYVTYTATDKSGNTTTLKRTINVKNNTGSKIIYLTFDDGPSTYTDKLLNVLKKYDVKATFFVTSNGSDSSILRAYNEGHSIALHTNTHNYSYIYQNADNYFEDLYAVQARVKRITGYESKLIRFPGGSSNTISKKYDGGTKIMSYLTKEVENRGFVYFDWNVSSGDAGSATTKEQVYKNVISSLKSGSSVVLQHDIKSFSVDAVEDIIKYGKANGYTFLPLDETSPTAHHGVNN